MAKLLNLVFKVLYHLIPPSLLLVNLRLQKHKTAHHFRVIFHHSISRPWFIPVTIKNESWWFPPPYPHQALYRFLRLFVVLFIPEHGTVICLRMLSTTHGAWNIVSPKNECIGSLYLASPPCYPTLPPISYTYETTSRL